MYGEAEYFMSAQYVVSYQTKAASKTVQGRVLYAAGSPFENVEYNGKLFKPGQGNNSYVFPGVGLAAVIWKAKKVPERAFLVAARVGLLVTISTFR